MVSNHLAPPFWMTASPGLGVEGSPQRTYFLLWHGLAHSQIREGTRKGFVNSSRASRLILQNVNAVFSSGKNWASDHSRSRATEECIQWVIKSSVCKRWKSAGSWRVKQEEKEQRSWGREGRASQHCLYLRSWQVWILWFENIKGRQNQHSEPWNNPASLAAFGCASSPLVRPVVYLHPFVYSSYIFSSPTHKILRRNSGENVFLA